MSFPILRTMRPRDTHEPHRASTPLELLFDLCFVVAVSQAVSQLHHFFAEGNFAEGIQRYVMVFFAIWWAWMGFTWFASGYDTDDVAYRVTVLIQIAGALIIAAGVSRVFTDQDFTIMVIGYVVMRLGLVSLWIRSARSDPNGGQAQRRSAFGVTLVQIGWLLSLLLPDGYGFAAWTTLVLIELYVPIWAAKNGRQAWHPHHIAERFGLFTLIVIGESVLGATNSFQTAIDSRDVGVRMLAIAAGGVLTLFGMWWLYFDQPTHDLLIRVRSEKLSLVSNAFIFGYGHCLIFASAAAVGGGLQIAVDFATHHTEITSKQASATVAVPAALYLAAIWALRLLLRQCSTLRSAAFLTAILLVLGTILLENPVLPIGLIVTGLVAVMIVTGQPRSDEEDDLVSTVFGGVEA